MGAKLFVSYASEDAAEVADIAKYMSDMGLSVWWDHSLVAGQDYRSVIDAQLDAADHVLVYWSPASINSRWVVAEAEHAARQSKLIPIRTSAIESWQIPKPFNTLHAVLISDRAAILRSVGVSTPPGNATPHTSQVASNEPEILFQCEVVQRNLLFAHSNCTLTVRTDGIDYENRDNTSYSRFITREALRGAVPSIVSRNVAIVMRDGSKFEFGIGTFGDRAVMEALVASIRKIT